MSFSTSVLIWADQYLAGPCRRRRCANRWAREGPWRRRREVCSTGRQWRFEQQGRLPGVGQGDAGVAELEPAAGTQAVDPVERVVGVPHHRLILLIPLGEGVPVHNHIPGQVGVVRTEGGAGQVAVRRPNGQGGARRGVRRERATGIENPVPCSNALAVPRPRSPPQQ